MIIQSTKTIPPYWYRLIYIYTIKGDREGTIATANSIVKSLDRIKIVGGENFHAQSFVIRSQKENEFIHFLSIYTQHDLPARNVFALIAPPYLTKVKNTIETNSKEYNVSFGREVLCYSQVGALNHRQTFYIENLLSIDNRKVERIPETYFKEVELSQILLQKVINRHGDLFANLYLI